MQYDIALKTLLECSRESFFRELMHIDLKEFQSIEELPTETVSVRSTDFPVKVIDADGRQLIHLIEFQSDWSRKKLLSMIQYKTRYQEKYELPVKSTLILFRKNRKAVDYYEDDELLFRFQLIKIWELPAKEFLNSRCLLPLVPLMKDGLSYTREVEDLLSQTEEERDQKLDKLTIFGILLGLKDKGLSQDYFRRRREIMIKYPMYEWILEEGIEKGIEKGIEQGIQRGKLEGAHEKALETARAMLNKDYSVNDIAELTGLSIQEIESLRQN